MPSYKVGCKTRGDSDWAYNALRFATREEAETYGADLFSRWTALREYEVHASEDAPNYQIKDGRLSEIRPPTNPEGWDVADTSHD